MHREAEPIVEHIEYGVGVGDDDRFIAAFSAVRAILLTARGFQNLAVTRGGGDGAEYRARVEWRSSVDREAFSNSDGARAIEQTLLAFERRSHRLERPVDLVRGEVDIDALALRRAFGHYPTGVAVITAVGPGGPTGLVVSSFTPVSLRPALVAFCAAHTSTTWPTIADARRCCVNILGASQAALCQKLASRREDRFEGVAWSAGPGGAPILGGAVGWLDCRVVETRPAGDHDLVILEVLAHGADPDVEPLLFHRSAYRSFVPTS